MLHQSAESSSRPASDVRFYREVGGAVSWSTNPCAINDLPSFLRLTHIFFKTCSLWNNKLSVCAWEHNKWLHTLNINIWAWLVEPLSYTFVHTVPLCHMVGLWVYTGLIQGIKWGRYVDRRLSFNLLCCCSVWHSWCRAGRWFGTDLTKKEKGILNKSLRVVIFKLSSSKPRFN